MRSILKPNVLALTALLIWNLGCSRGGDSELRVPDGTPIILISVDTLRSDRLPVYGYGGVETPAIDEFRRDGILFERAYTHVPVTLPAHTSLLTGLLPSTHGVRDNLGYTVDTTKARLLQQTLKEAGYATGAGVSAFALRRATGIGAGFDFYQDESAPSGGPVGHDAQSSQRPGGETLAAVRPWLRSVTDRPFFLFFHIFEPHTPYEPPAKFAARYPSPYDGEVAAADEVIGELLDELRALDVYDQALIVFLSDHGEDLGDHGEDEHGVFLYRSTLQVPLILKLPKQKRAGETVSDPVQLIDVYPTVVAALGLPYGEELQGTPLLAPSRPDPRDNPIYAETFYPRIHFGWSDLAAMIADSDHFIDAPDPELFDIVDDPDEKKNLIGTKLELEAELRAALGAYDRELDAPGPTDPETRRRLAALGYVGAASTSDDDVLPDPKTRVHFLPDIQRAYTLYHDGELEAAVTALQLVLKDNPKIEDAWGYLTLAQLELGRPGDAAATVQSALENLPNSKRLSMRAARLLEHMGRLDEASVYATAAVPYDPPAAHLLLAQIALKKGDLDGAETEARAAMASGNRQPEPRLILADVFSARGQPNQAIDLLTRTLQEGINDTSIHAKLAITHAWIGDHNKAEQVLSRVQGSIGLGYLLQFGKLAISRQMWDEAQHWFDRALALDPTNPEIKYHLGLVALNQGRLPEARTLLQDSVASNLGSFEAWSALGMVFARMGDPEGAILAWNRTLEINPGFIEVLYNLGVAHAQLGRLPQAISYLEDFTARAPEGPQREQALNILQQMRASRVR